MEGFLLQLGRALSPRYCLLSIFLLLFSINSIQAKTVVIGGGSGFITVAGMTGLNPGDSLAITSGLYSGASFSNLKGITITNNGGSVVFNGQVTLNTMVECVFSGFQFRNVKGTSIRWVGNSRRSTEKYISFMYCTGITNDANDNNVYNGDTSTLKLYMCTFDSLTLFSSGIVLRGSYGDAKDRGCYMDSIVLSRIKVDSTLGNGLEVGGVIFRIDAHDWIETYKGVITQGGDVGIFQIYGNGSIHNIYRIGGRGYIARIWDLGLKVPGNTYYYNNIDLNTAQYGSLDTKIDQTQFIQYITGANCFIFNNTVGNKEEHIGYWSSVAVVGDYPSPWVCQVRNNLGFNLQTNGKPPITANQSNGSWKSDSSNNMYFTKPDGVIDPVTCIPFANSPVLGMGLTLNLVQDDYYHNPRIGANDIGAVQHGGPAIPPPANKSPVAIGDAARTMTLPTSNTILDGSKSYDPDGIINSYAWVLLTGTGGTLATPSSATTLVSGLTQGTYIYQLTVTDNNNVSSSALDTIVVNPEPSQPPPNVSPIANAGPDQIITAPSNAVNLNGAGSYDPDGNITAYTWILVSGPGAIIISNANAASAAASGLEPGIYTFQLTVTDNNGSSSTDSVSITVLPALIVPNQSPVANAGSNQVIAAPTNSITLNGTNSFDPDGTIDYFAWTQISGPSSAGITNNNTASATATGLIAGTYVFQLIVTDNNGATDADEVNIQVNPEVNKINLAPIAQAGTDTTIYMPASRYVLNASASYDPDGNITSYQWQEISGPNTAIASPMSGLQVDVTNLQQGVYQFELTVTDNQGATSTATIKIAVDKGTGGSDQLIVFPNPAHDILNSRITSTVNGTVHMVMYDMNGKMVMSGEADKSTDQLEKSLNVSSLAAGMYTIQVNIANRKTLATKFIKR